MICYQHFYFFKVHFFFGNYQTWVAYIRQFIVVHFSTNGQFFLIFKIIENIYLFLKIICHKNVSLVIFLKNSKMHSLSNNKTCWVKKNNALFNIADYGPLES